MNVQITPGFLHPPDSERVGAFPGLEGALCVTVNGTTLTGTGDDTCWDRPLFAPDGAKREAAPTGFVGEDIGLSVASIESAIDPFIENTVERHREYTAEIHAEPGSTVLAISRLDNMHVRLAALPRLLDQSNQPQLSAQIGYATTPEAISSALADCIRECLEYTRRAYIVEERHTDFETIFQEYKDNQEQKINRLESFSSSK